MTTITPGATMFLAQPDDQYGTGYTVVRVVSPPVNGNVLVQATNEDRRLSYMVTPDELHPVETVECSHDELDVAWDAFTEEPFHYCAHCMHIVSEGER